MEYLDYIGHLIATCFAILLVAGTGYCLYIIGCAIWGKKK
jgi:hypothetical protein